MTLDSSLMSNPEVSYSAIGGCKVDAFSPVVTSNIMHADLVVLGFALSEEQLPCIHQRLGELQGMTRAPVIVIGTKNFGWNNNAVMLIDKTRRYSFRVNPLAKIVAINDIARAQFNRETYIDIMAMITDGDGRVPVFTPDRKFISQDRSHLTKAGAKYLGSIIFQHPSLLKLATMGDRRRPE